jgi:hypothetical protein
MPEHATSQIAIERPNHGLATPLCPLWSGIHGPITPLDARIDPPRGVPALSQRGRQNHADREAHLDRRRRQVRIAKLGINIEANCDCRSSIGGTHETRLVYRDPAHAYAQVTPRRSLELQDSWDGTL